MFRVRNGKINFLFNFLIMHYKFQLALFSVCFLKLKKQSSVDTRFFKTLYNLEESIL